MSTKCFMFEQYQLLRFVNKIYLKFFFIFHYNIANKCKLNSNLKNLKSFCGKKDVFDCTGIRAQVFRLPIYIFKNN